jgi:hypothetical protein
LQDRELVAQHEDLGILRPVSATPQHQQVEYEPDKTVEASHALILIDARRTDQTESRNPRSRQPDEFSAPTGSAPVTRVILCAVVRGSAGLRLPFG